MRSFDDGLRVAVIGAGGGIGGALVDVLANDPSVETVFALARKQSRLDQPGVVLSSVDVESEDSIADAARRIGDRSEPLDIVLVASGVLHDGDTLQPEKSWKALDAAVMARVFQVNSIGPALIAKHFLPLLARNRKTLFAALSARVGSIEDNRLGGWYAYRASKAALNMMIKSLSIELARSRPDAVCIALHPGTVDSALSKPFQGGVGPKDLVSPMECARNLLNVADRVTVGDSGGFFAYDGSAIPY